MKLSIKVNIHEAYRYMGGIGEPEVSLTTELQRAADLILSESSAKVVYRQVSISRRYKSAIYLDDAGLMLHGQSAAALLHDSCACILFCATIGNGIESLLRRWQIRDMSFASMLDACGSSAVESLCDSLEEQLINKYTAEGLYLTDRFSPGYGDLPLSLQPDMCNYLDTSRKIGVSIGNGCFMIPRKSVTALIGISHYPQSHRDVGCQNCPCFDSCSFREKGMTCYGQPV